MGGGVLLLCLVVAESCWAAGGNPGEAQTATLYDLSTFRWPYAYSPAALYKRLPQYNFGLGKRANSKLYSFGLGKRSADYEDEDEDEQLEELLDADKRSRGYSFGLGKRAKPYSFGLGKRAKAYSFGLGKRADRKLYSFGLGKRLPSGERRYAFGLGKRSDSETDDLVDSEETWQTENAVGKREVPAVELHEVATESKQDVRQDQAAELTDGGADNHEHTVRKRAAPMQYSFGLGKRADDQDEDVLELQDLDDDTLARATRRQYGFGLGKRMPFRQFGAKRGPRQYGFGLGRRSMQYNFGIGKRSPEPTPVPAER